MGVGLVDFQEKSSTGARFGEALCFASILVGASRI